jgi:hypothetical protein
MPNPPASHSSSMSPLRTSSPRRMATWLLRDVSVLLCLSNLRERLLRTWCPPFCQPGDHRLTTRPQNPVPHAWPPQYEQQSPNPVARPRVRYHYGATPDALRAMTPRTPAEPIFQRAQSPRRMTRPSSVPNRSSRFNGHQWLIATPVCEKGLTQDNNLAAAILVRTHSAAQSASACLHARVWLPPITPPALPPGSLDRAVLAVCLQPGHTQRFASNPRANLRFQATGHSSEQW